MLIVIGLERHWRPKRCVQITFSFRIKLNSLRFQHRLLQIDRQCHLCCRTFALSVYDTLPWDVFRVGPMHYIADSSCRVALAKDLGDLAVRHHTPARYLSHKVVYAFAIAGLIGEFHRFLKSPSDEYDSCGRAV